MNKHTALNEKTGKVHTRNSKNRTYSYVVVADFYWVSGKVTGNAWFTDQWTSRLDLAQKNANKVRTEVASWVAENEYLDSVDVQILKAEVAA